MRRAGKAREGAIVDERVKQLIAEFSEAIKDSLLESEQIAGIVAKIRAGGYDVFLVLNATIGLTEQKEQPVGQAAHMGGQTEFRLSSQDAKFLKTMHITVDNG